MNHNEVEAFENEELINKLKDSPYRKFVDALIENEEEVYTKKGRLNKSSACRKLGIKSKDLDNALSEMREILSAES